MSPPHIPKIGATTVPTAASPRAGGQGAGARLQKAEAQVASQAVERAVVVNRSLELLETMAGRVSEATGESLDVSRPAQAVEADSSYRVQLMSFIVGSLSKASQAFRQRAAAQVEPEEPEAAEDAVEEAEEETGVDAALPEAPVSDPVEAAAEATPLPSGLEATVDAQTTGYGSKGQAVQSDQASGASIDRWV
jgi:hypothetical protein